MKYSILINQLAVVNNNLHDDTDLIDWALMDYIQQWITHPKAQKLGDKVWINYKHILTEMPLLGLKAKSSISNRVHKLESLGLIETEKDDSFRLFVKMTNKAHQVITFHECSQDTTTVPNEERGVHSQEQGVPNEERGVPEIVHSTNNQALNHHEQTISIKKGSYAYSGERIKVTYKHYDEMEKNYPNLDLIAELNQLDLELRDKKSYWLPLQAKLNYRNKQAGKNNGKPKQSIYEQNMEAHERDRRRLMGEDATFLPDELDIDERQRLLN